MAVQIDRRPGGAIRQVEPLARVARPWPLRYVRWVHINRRDPRPLPWPTAMLPEP